jgi:hypothetical protein
MRNAILTAFAFAALSACAAAASPSAPSAPTSPPPLHAQTQPASAPAPVWCDIRITPTRNGARFEPVAQSPYPVAGSYRFVLTRTDVSGSSDVEQSGSFDLAGDRLVVLGSSELSFDRGARFRARLVLEDRRGIVCRQEVRS